MKLEAFIGFAANTADEHTDRIGFALINGGVWAFTCSAGLYSYEEMAAASKAGGQAYKIEIAAGVVWFTISGYRRPITTNIPNMGACVMQGTLPAFT